MSRWHHLAILVAIILAVIAPRTASASIAATTEARVGDFRLHAPALGGLVTTQRPENHRAKSLSCRDLASEHSLRWKGMWRFDVGAGVELYVALRLAAYDKRITDQTWRGLDAGRKELLLPLHDDRRLRDAAQHFRGSTSRRRRPRRTCASFSPSPASRPPSA